MKTITDKMENKTPANSNIFNNSNSFIIIKKSKSKINKCQYCFNEYTRKSSYTRHTVFCEMIHKSKRERICEEEESKIPTLKEMYIVMQEMTYNYKKMEDKLKELQKWVNRKKTKLDVVSWLNSNLNVVDVFEEWIKKIVVTEEDMFILQDKQFIDTINSICSRIITENIPIICFEEKSNVFYIYTNINIEEDNDEQTQCWVKMSSKNFNLMVRILHSKVFKIVCLWKNENEEKILKNKKMDELYNKILMKVMKFDFSSELLMSKIRVILFSHLKKKLCELITGFEFDFD